MTPAATKKTRKLLADMERVGRAIWVGRIPSTCIAQGTDGRRRELSFH